MDIEKLIERLKSKDFERDYNCTPFECGVFGLLDDAATALSTLRAENAKLLARAEVAEADNERLREAMKPNCIGCDWMHSDNGNCTIVGGFCTAVLAAHCPLIPKLRDELEQVKRERDALIEDFVDYVTGGVPNPAIFCKNRCDKCTDMRGWCTGKNCNGFYPSGASGPEEG